MYRSLFVRGKQITLAGSSNLARFSGRAAGYDRSDVLLITGGAGFLGQHIIRLIQETPTSVYSRIKVYDLMPYTNRLGHNDRIPVDSAIGDVTDKENMLKEFRGVTSVIHIAALVSFGVNPDFEGMEQVNVQGTRKVVAACVANNIERLTFCSSVDVVIGQDEIVDGTEDSTGVPTQFLMEGYPSSKHRAEMVVLSANGTQLANGKTLNTVSLRANIMYGELDPYFVTNALKDAKKARGTLVRVGNGAAVTQVSYVGNAAWAFVIVDDRLRESATTGGNIQKDGIATRTPLPEDSYRNTIGGNAYFIPDETSNVNVFDFLHPFLQSRGYKLSAYSIPYSILFALLSLRDFLIWVVSPVMRFISRWVSLETKPGVSLSSITYLNKTFTFSNAKAKKSLGYEPKYDPKESLQRSLSYYKHIKL